MNRSTGMAEDGDAGNPPHWESGPPLLFVHGMWHGEWCWKHFVALFRAAGFNAHAFNLTAHGGEYAGSRGRLWRPVIGTYLEDLRREVRKFKTTPILVGHSLGCHLIEVLMAELRPPAAILLAPTRPGVFARSVWRFFLRHPFELCWLIFLLTMWPPIRNLRLARELLFTTDFPENELQELHKDFLQNESYWIAAQLLVGGLLPFLNIAWKPAAPFGTPVYVVGGDIDLAVLTKDLRQVAAFHSAEVRIFPGMAHDLMLGPQHETVAKDLLRWLKELPQIPR